MFQIFVIVFWYFNLVPITPEIEVKSELYVLSVTVHLYQSFKIELLFSTDFLITFGIAYKFI